MDPGDRVLDRCLLFLSCEPLGTSLPRYFFFTTRPPDLFMGQT